ncbi:MAG: hypothetical protein B7Z37_00120 [Verrucomicrobia bacterium 12-59-8]|nr:MAG: hypothetical protein B7Z37_00120 [Verrucomicrobia bacterium 12-59-8]
MTDKHINKPVGATSDPVAKQKIVSAARRHFLANGFRGVTMDDLAVELGMSKKTFYAHFKSKVALVEAVMQDKMTEVESDLERLLGGEPALFQDALHGLLACLQKHTGEIQPVFLRDIRRDAPELFAVVESRRAVIIERCFMRLLTSGGKAGMIRADVSAKLVIELLLAAMHGIMNPKKLEELKLTPKAGFSAILNVILGGVMTAKGRATL